MRELRQKQRLKEMAYSWPSLIIMSLITLFLIKGAVGVMLKERGSAERVAMLESEAIRMEERENELKEGIGSLKTEEGVTAMIRDKYSVTREGEYVAIIVDEKSADDESEEKLPWYKRWWDAIIDRNDK